MRNAAFVVTFVLLLAFQSGLSTAIDLHPWVPVLIYPIVFYLGTAAEVTLLRGSTLSFAAGLIYDSFCGSSMGLHTFVTIALFFAARLVRDRLVVQGPVAQLFLTFLMTAVGGGLLLALRAIFSERQPFALPSMWVPTEHVLASAMATALVAPLIFGLAQRVDRISTHSRTS